MHIFRIQDSYASSKNRIKIQMLNVASSEGPTHTRLNGLKHNGPKHTARNIVVVWTKTITAALEVRENTTKTAKETREAKVRMVL